MRPAENSPFRPLATAATAYGLVVERFVTFVRVVAAWVGIELAAVWGEYAAWTQALRADAGLASWYERLPSFAQPMVASSFSYVVTLIASAAMAVGWHRFVILGEEPRSLLYFHPVPTARFLYRWFAVVLIVGGILVPIALLSVTIFGAARAGPQAYFLQFVPMLVITLLLAAFARTGLAFPAAAVGEKKCTLRYSWRRTRGHSLPLLGGMLLAIGPFYALNSVISWLNALADVQENAVATIAVSAAGYVFHTTSTVVSAGYFALAFVELAEPENNASAVAAHFK